MKNREMSQEEQRERCEEQKKRVMSSDCWWSNCEAMHFYNWMCSSSRTHGCKVCHLAFLQTWFFKLFECLVREQIKWTTFSCFIFYSFFVIAKMRFYFRTMFNFFTVSNKRKSREKIKVFLWIRVSFYLSTIWTVYE